MYDFEQWITCEPNKSICTTLTTIIKNFKDEFPYIRNWDRTVTTVTRDVFYNLKKKYKMERLSAQELEEKAQASRAASRMADIRKKRVDIRKKKKKEKNSKNLEKKHHFRDGTEEREVPRVPKWWAPYY
ncbi:hypothetical protein BDA99DRAFT_544570 [Phascolomyces articulosus]|uniref:Uncharacterized protein n=1 Tax=Phascolomyces articulosus TaxID=60185 RepID=A0AAD5P715_9FUNG|nr:hypothetical protein BDA99DRAFT_544570 [Phascolomyces articulosus]